MGMGQSANMKTFIALLSFCSLALGRRGSKTKDDGSLTFSGLEVIQGCTAGTPLGAKLSAALEDCSGNPESVKPEMEAVMRGVEAGAREEGGQEAGDPSAPLQRRSRPRWELRWPETCVSCTAWAGSTRRPTRTTPPWLCGPLM